ncbi:phytase [Spirosoma aureum]|uniref:Phytase n=1 Tax=Spirosoma aureum TaxID=2692134 RepID=A0A6G9AS93_9BACT|nr:phytase [Spirosoma aureum]QIP15280.1 phytase [Spirosoma aureum]
MNKPDYPIHRLHFPLYFILTGLFLVAACQHPSAQTTTPEGAQSAVIQPIYITDTVRHDTDDPAIWINPADPTKSLVIGTDKDQDGGLYVFDLKGKIVREVHDLKRPDNVDVAYGLMLGGKPTDIAVTTERFTHKLRIFSLPDMKSVDKGGLEMFVGDTSSGFRDLMGIALYKTPAGILYAMVGRKTGPTDGSYIGQYRLEDDGTGQIQTTLVRKFGAYSGKKEIESIAVDNELGFVYYSDEGVGVRKYYADPAKGNQELALFARTGFAEDHEGISIYKTGPKTGFILVSDQGANQFHIFKREGESSNPNDHKLVKIVKVAAQVSDGSDVTNVALGKQFPHGLFVVMSDDKTFHYYRCEDIIGNE